MRKEPRTRKSRQGKGTTRILTTKLQEGHYTMY